MSPSTTPIRAANQDLSGREVLALLWDGNRRFVRGESTQTDPHGQVEATADGQHPLAVVLACMDSRIATELIFDLGLGDIFSVRVAGNVASTECLGSMELGCAVAGAPLLLVLGHTRCGAVTAAIDRLAGDAAKYAGLENLGSIVEALAGSVRAETETLEERNGRNEVFVRRVAVLNVLSTMARIRQESAALRARIEGGEVRLVGGLYDVTTGVVEFFESEGEAREAAGPGPGTG